MFTQVKRSVVWNCPQAMVHLKVEIPFILNNYILHRLSVSLCFFVFFYFLIALSVS